MSVIRKYEFDQADPIVVETPGGDYATDTIEFDPIGVFLVRNGEDRVFIPWCGVTRVYQVI